MSISGIDCIGHALGIRTYHGNDRYCHDSVDTTHDCHRDSFEHDIRTTHGMSGYASRLNHDRVRVYHATLRRLRQQIQIVIRMRSQEEARKNEASLVPYFIDAPVSVSSRSSVLI